MAGLGDFIKKNARENSAGAGGKAFLAFDIANLITAENKLKAIWDIFKDLILLRPIMAAAFAGMFTSMQKSIRALVHDTGSLEAALKKLAQIQGLQKIFKPLEGGAEAAKKKVAELVNFAASKNLKLDAVGQAAQTLAVMTRNAFSGAKALDLINDAAKGTGNSIEDVAEAVGDFANELRGGGSIDGATEQLRRMGLITQTTADELVYLQQNGSGVDAVFGKLKDTLGSFAGDAAKAAGGVDEVNAAYAAAKKNLQEKFGSPFTESDIQNTKNWTAAMNAIAPVVGSLAVFFEKLIGGMGTLAGWFAKGMAESSAFRGTIEFTAKAVGILITGASALSAILLSAWLIQAAATMTGTAAAMIGFAGATGVAATAITYFTSAVRLLMAGTGIGMLLLLLGTGVAVWQNWTSEAEKAQKVQEDLAKSTEQTTKALKEQEAATERLAQKYKALGDAMIKAGKDQKAIKETELDILLGEATPARQAQILSNRGTELINREDRAKAGVDARQAFIASGGSDEVARNAPRDSSVFLEYIARLRQSYDPAGAEEKRSQAALRQEEENNLGNITQERMRVIAQKGALGKQRAFGIAEGDQELLASLAEMQGDAARMQQLKYSSMNRSKYQDLLGKGLDPTDANRVAGTLTDNAIALDARGASLAANAAVAATGLAKIGGGGNIAEGGEDPALSVARTQLEVQQDMRAFLEQMAKSNGGVFVIP